MAPETVPVIRLKVIPRTNTLTAIIQDAFRLVIKLRETTVQF